MFPYNRAKLPPFLERWLSANKIMIEIILVFTALLCGYVAGMEVLMIVMTTLAVFYFLLAYTTPVVQDWLGHISYRVFNIGSAVMVIGLLFDILMLVGAKEMMRIGAITLVVSGGIMGYQAATKWNEKFFPLFIRIVVLMGMVYLFGIVKGSTSI